MKLLIALYFILFSSQVFAKNKYNISIQDVNQGTTYNVEAKFKDSLAGQRKYFDVPNSVFKCTFVFFDMKTGTSLVCASGSHSGKNFFKSDRSGLNEKPSANHLSFRVGNIYAVIKATCK